MSHLNRNQNRPKPRRRVLWPPSCCATWTRHSLGGAAARASRTCRRHMHSRHRLRTPILPETSPHCRTPQGVGRSARSRPDQKLNSLVGAGRHPQHCRTECHSRCCWRRCPCRLPIPDRPWRPPSPATCLSRRPHFASARCCTVRWTPASDLRSTTAHRAGG